MDFDTKEERKFENRHLKAYLKNQDYFTYDGMRFKTQCGVSLILMTETEALSKKQEILDAIEAANNKQTLKSTISTPDASKSKVYA